jgi:hypothetical protein
MWVRETWEKETDLLTLLYEIQKRNSFSLNIPQSLL